MTTTPYAFGIHGQPIVRAREAVGDWRLAENDRWTAAHAEVARFLGECCAVGAVLGLVVELARPRRGERHGPGTGEPRPPDHRPWPGRFRAPESCLAGLDRNSDRRTR